MVQKGNIEVVDMLLRNLCHHDLLFGGKIFISIGDFYQVVPVIPYVLDMEYLRLIDDIGNSINGENISLSLLTTTHKLDDTIDFIFPTSILNNSIAFLQ
ncbi:4174_t:CDS:2 [Diversispora eburnea]|uniref:4174_t:CDS:1 n=1 Tax=Diversispora eburnea TaxID=1213867 RepID=A0A9N9D256_9GLOM|nr:4174_t:CDS:2 [Diversispora eburnea]